MEDFIKLSDRFFYYLQYGLMICPETILRNEKNFVGYALRPKDFFPLLNEFELVYPYNWEIEIIKISNKVKENNLNIDDCLNVIKNYESQYIFGNPILFKEQIDKIKEEHKRVNKEVTEKDLLHFIVEYLNYLSQKRDEIIESLIKSIKQKKKQSTPPPEPKTPFTDPKTHELFNYIVDGWSYDKGQKWADIWNLINDLENYTPPYKNEYQNYIITRFGYTGKFQYDKPKKDGNRDKQNLLELIENFSKK